MFKTNSSKALLAVICVALFANTTISYANTQKDNQNAKLVKVNADNTLDQTAILKEQAGSKIKLFAATLKKALMSAVEQGGLTNGIDVCQSEAPKIAASLSTDGWKIGRTSLKVRNTNNEPDQWEQGVLEQFEARTSAGEDITTLVASKHDADGFRLMKAIPTGQLCMACHGSSVDQKTLEKINEVYPKDEATGFSAGDLRGAFSVYKEVAQ